MNENLIKAIENEINTLPDYDDIGEYCLFGDLYYSLPEWQDELDKVCDETGFDMNTELTDENISKIKDAVKRI